MQLAARASFHLLLLLVACPAAPVAQEEAEPPPPEDSDGDGFDIATDCDDADPAVNPDATEVCGGGDEDCDGLVDDADPSVSGTEELFLDRDGDRRGDPASPIQACVLPVGADEDGTDCDDTDATVHPLASEVCNGRDDDCDGKIDDEDDSLQAELVLYPDGDGDGHGDGSRRREACGPIEGWVTDGTDPDDDDASVWLPRDVYEGDLTGNFGAFCVAYAERDLDGDLDLSTATEADVEALYCLRSVSGDLFMWNNTTLTRLSGLPQLIEVGGELWIEGNPALTTISGFDILEGVQGSLQASHNPLLEELSAFDKLTTVEGELTVGGNAELRDFTGFPALSAVGVVSIYDNPSLLDVTGFGALERIGNTAFYP